MRCRPKNRRLFWLACFCMNSKRALAEAAESDLFDLIAEGNSEELERCLGYIQSSVKLTVRRRHPTQTLGTFYQECSPVICAVDCRQWQLLPIMWRHGYDINRPQICRRWACFCSQQTRPNNSPYRKIWTRGQYTYQSILDYIFASIYETYGEIEAQIRDTSLSNPLHSALSCLPSVLNFGINVHRIDSIIVFNSLSASFDRYICGYFNDADNLLPDIPKHDNAFIELEVLQNLIEHGYSEFECIEYMSPNTNWIGLLICLLAHPCLSECVDKSVPALLRVAASLLINLIALRSLQSNNGELYDCVNHLRLRKTYVKRYCDQRTFFQARLLSVVKECKQMSQSPPTLSLLARNRIRRMIGGVNFKRRLSTLGLPSKFTAYISYIGPEHSEWVSLPSFIASVAAGRLTSQTFQELDDQPIVNEPVPPLKEARVLQSPTLSLFNNSETFPQVSTLTSVKRRASAVLRYSRFQRQSVRAHSMGFRCPIRPSSAPVLKLAHTQSPGFQFF